MKKVLIKFRHGLGDAVQLTIVLKHIQQQCPSWVVDVESLVGKHTCFYGLCNASYRAKRDNVNFNSYDKIFNVGWHDPDTTMRFDCPATKATRSLIKEFKLEPNPELFTYEVPISKEANIFAQQYLNLLPQKRGFVTIHYQGNTSRSNKNIPENIIKNIIQSITAAGYMVIILDWDNRSNLPNKKNVFRPGKKEKIWNNTGTGDASTIAALIQKSALFIGIDSGPLHVAGATSTKSIGVWIKHHPIHYFDIANNVIHLVANPPQQYVRSNNKTKIIEYFEENYRYKYYGNLSKVLLSETKNALGINNDACDDYIPEKSDTIVLNNQWFGLGLEPASTFFC
jgi:ADP-heptose:LPS heptosyltransferase